MMEIILVARPKGHSLDAVDLAIVAALLKDANLTFKQLGAIIGKGRPFARIAQTS